MSRQPEETKRPQADTSRLKRRDCLRCSKPFPSHGPHIRLCQKCREHLEHNPVVEPTHLGVSRTPRR